MMSLDNAIPMLILFGQSVVIGEAFFMNRMSVAEFLESPMMASLDKPLVIENALEWRDCQYWWKKHILTRSGSEAVIVERRDAITTSIPLQKAAHLAISESSHSNPIHISSQGRSCSTDQLPFHDLLESLSGAQ